MSGSISDSVRNETTRRLSSPVDRVPTSFMGRSRRQIGTLFQGGRLLFGRSYRSEQDEMQAALTITSSLGELKGVTMKLGQVLGYFQNDLPSGIRAALSLLCTRAHPLPFGRVRAVIRQELSNRAADLIDRMDPDPLSVASIGQIHRAVLPDGQPVAVKVQYPGIDKAIQTDFRSAAIGATLAALFYPGAKIRTFVREARDRFLEECDYLKEAKTQQRFRDLYAHHPVIQVPRVHGKYSTGRVLTTALSEGVHLDQYLAQNPDGDARNRAGTALYELYYGSLYKFGLYHCDPHPGNYLFRPDGRLIILDFGCAREFAPDFVDRLATLTEAVHAGDHHRQVQAMVDMGILRAGRSYDPDALGLVLRSLYGPMVRGGEFTVEPGQSKVPRNKLIRLALPGEFLFLLRVRFGLAAVLSRLGSRANWQDLEADYIAERPIRLGGQGITHFDVILNGAGENQIAVIRAIRAATGKDLKQVKTLVEDAPQPVRRAVSRLEAEALYETLQAAGGDVVIKPSQTR